MNILIADDEKLIRNVIKEYCLVEKFNVYEAENGIEAIRQVENNPIDLVILDIMMPSLDGYSACKRIKEIKNIPIIMLSARVEEYDKLAGFELGIDDYVTKPFSPKELMARIKAVLKRNDTLNSKFVYKGLEVDFKGRCVLIDGVEANLTFKEYELLKLFISNPNIALPRELILNRVWGYDFYGDDRTIDTHIKMLRNNLGKYRNLIKTVRAVGYKFEIKEK